MVGFVSRCVGEQPGWVAPQLVAAMGHHGDEGVDGCVGREDHRVHIKHERHDVEHREHHARLNRVHKKAAPDGEWRFHGVVHIVDVSKHRCAAMLKAVPPVAQEVASHETTGKPEKECRHTGRSFGYLAASNGHPPDQRKDGEIAGQRDGEILGGGCEGHSAKGDIGNRECQPSSDHGCHHGCDEEERMSQGVVTEG